MNPQAVERPPSGGARSKLLGAAFSIVRQKGYAGTSVDEFCARAGVTKGAFFHHFPSKDSLAVAAVNQWTEMTTAFFAAAPYHGLDDPLDRVLGYLDFRKAMLRGDVAEFSRLAGTMVQEAYETHPDIRDACDTSIGSQAAMLESDIADAMKRYRIVRDGPPKASRCTRKPCCRARSSWRKPRATPRWPKRASTTCVAMLNCCFVAQRKGESEELTMATSSILWPDNLKGK